MDKNAHWKEMAKRLGEVVTNEQISLPSNELQAALVDVEGGEDWGQLPAREFASVHAELKVVRSLDF